MIVKIQRGRWDWLISEVTDVEVKRHNYDISEESERKRLHDNLADCEPLLTQEFWRILNLFEKDENKDTEYLDYFIISYWKKDKRKSVAVNGKVYIMENGKTSDMIESFRIKW